MKPYVILKPESVKYQHFGPGTHIKEMLSTSDQLSVNPTNPQAGKPMNLWTEHKLQQISELIQTEGLNEVCSIPPIKIFLEKLQP